MTPTPASPTPVPTTRLGGTGLRVSRLALGCMSFGDTSTGWNGWSLGYDDALPIVREALDLGITFWDTANIYNFGTSEQIVRAMLQLTRREDVVLATKLNFRMHDGPGGAGLSRRAVMEQVDASLRRLGMDFIDLYQIHRFDPETPVEETMEALHDVVKAGKVRYLGASSMWAWQFAKLQSAARENHWTPFVTMQNQYSLMMREDEREMFPLLADQGVGSIPWSPLAKGRLARPWSPGSTARSGDDPVQQRLFRDADKPIADTVEAIAAERGVPMAQVALAWVLRNPVVDAPIIGATKPGYLTDAAGAFAIDLTDDEVARLEQHYTLRMPTGF